MTEQRVAQDLGWETSNFNQRMRLARLAAGFTLDDVAFILRRDFAPVAKVSSATISRLETRTPEATADYLLVSLLAGIYGIPTAKLSPMAEEWRTAATDALVNYSLKGDDSRRAVLVGATP